MSGKNPDSSDKFIVVDNIESNSSRQSFKILVGTGSSKQDFVGALSTSFLKQSTSTRRKAVKDEEQWEEWRLTVLHKFSVASDIFLIKNDPMSLAKANLSPWGGKGVSAVCLNSFFVAAKSFRWSPEMLLFTICTFFYLLCFNKALIKNKKDGYRIAQKLFRTRIRIRVFPTGFQSIPSSCD